MGVTMHSKHYSLDVPYGGFKRLREKVAELYSEEVGRHYKELDNAVLLFSDAERQEFYTRYDAETERIAATLDQNGQKVLSFLYTPDAEGSVTYGTCKVLLKVIGDYDDNLIYGYAGWKSPVKFADFRKLLQDCLNNKTPLRWF